MAKEEIKTSKAEEFEAFETKMKEGSKGRQNGLRRIMDRDGKVHQHNKVMDRWREVLLRYVRGSRR